MKQFRTYLFVLLSLVGIQSLAAAPKAETAAAVLSRCAARLNNAQSVTAAFTLTAGSSRYSCDMVIAKQKFRMNTPLMSVWYDGATQWVYDTRRHSLSITGPTADELMETNPFAILHHYGKSYTLRLLKSDMPGTKAVELTPKSPAMSSVRRATVTIDDKTSMPLRIAVTLSDGSTLSAAVASCTAGKAVAPSTFVFPKKQYKVDETIDLR